jgi:hypothetical protein
MANQKPDPKILKRKLADIKLRYDSHARETAHKNSNRSRGMAAIRLSELTRWLGDTYGKGVELEHSDYHVVRIFVHHLGALKDAPRRITSWVGTYAPWISPHDLERLILETESSPMRWTADKLGWKLQLTQEQRTRLKIRTIGAKGVNKQMRMELRREAEAKRQRERRAMLKAVRSI